MLRVVFKLQNVRRAPGDAGRLPGFTEIVNETENNVYIKPNGTTSPWPGPMYLVVSRRCIQKHVFFDFDFDCWIPVRPVIPLRLLIPYFESIDLLPACYHLYIMLNHDLLWSSLFACSHQRRFSDHFISRDLAFLLSPIGTTIMNDRNPYDLREKYTRFRILVIGRANAGKTTVLQRVCNTTEDPCIYDENSNNLVSS